MFSSLSDFKNDIDRATNEVKKRRQAAGIGLIQIFNGADGDRKLRRELGHEGYRGLYDDLLTTANDIFPQTKGVQLRDIPRGKGRANAYYDPIKGTVNAGLPSRAAMAHELGHAASIPPKSLRGTAKTLYLSGLSPLLTASVSYGLAKRLGLSDDQAYAASVVPTFGAVGMFAKGRIKEEFDASRNALRILHKYNKTLDPMNNKARDNYYQALAKLENMKKSMITPTATKTSAEDLKQLADKVKLLNKRIARSVVTPVDTKKAKDSLKFALGTYKKRFSKPAYWALPAAMFASIPYTVDKIRSKYVDKFANNNNNNNQ